LAIIGPPGSGKDKIGKHFANTYGLVTISKLSVLWAESQKDTSLAVAAKTAIEKGEWLDDEVMAKLVIQRLSEPDCEFNGYVLLDFPDTVKQFTLLQQSNKVPKILCFRE